MMSFKHSDLSVCHYNLSCLRIVNKTVFLLPNYLFTYLPNYIFTYVHMYVRTYVSMYLCVHISMYLEYVWRRSGLVVGAQDFES